MTKGIPVLAGRNELERLHSIAHTAALQTGAKGHALDQTTEDILAAMLKRSNAAWIEQYRRAKLHVVE